MVLVSHAHRFIFLKTHKTASTSVEVLFEPFCVSDPDHVPHEFGREVVSPAGMVGDRRGREARLQYKWNAHLPASYVAWHLGPRRFARYFRFITTRNPWDKMVARFLYARRNRTELLTGPLPKRRRAYTRWLHKQRFINDRYIYCIAGVPVFNDAIRYEHLEEDVQRVAQTLGVDADPGQLPSLKRLSSRPRDPYAGYYTPETRDHIARAFRHDIRRFGYRFED